MATTRMTNIKIGMTEYEWMGTQYYWYTVRNHRIEPQTKQAVTDALEQGLPVMATHKWEGTSKRMLPLAHAIDPAAAITDLETLAKFVLDNIDMTGDATPEWKERYDRALNTWRYIQARKNELTKEGTA